MEIKVERNEGKSIKQLIVIFKIVVKADRLQNIGKTVKKNSEMLTERYRKFLRNLGNILKKKIWR